MDLKKITFFFFLNLNKFCLSLEIIDPGYLTQAPKHDFLPTLSLSLV